MNPARIAAAPGRAIACSILILMALVGLCFGLEEASSTVTVAYVEGEATLTPAGRDASVVLTEDRVVKAGDRIDTGKDGSVELVLPDESAVRIGPDSRIVVREAGYVEVTKKSSNVLNLLYGKIRAVVAPLLNAESTFIIETENATVGVRGTDFVVSHDKTAKETDVLCSDGSVELRPKDIVRKGLVPILVRGDEGIRLIAGRLPERPARWVDNNRLRMLRNLDFKGKRTKKIFERRLKYLQNKGESAVGTLKSGGNTLKGRTNRTMRSIFRR